MASREATIRSTVAGDLDAIGEIYAHHVLTGVATFETTPPDHREWTRRFRGVIDDGLPFVTAEVDGVVAGYAYCVQWKSRPAYRHTVEDSIYLAPHAAGHGIGGRLLDVLLAAALTRVCVKSSPSSWTRTPTLLLRCTVIGASSRWAD